MSTTRIVVGVDGSPGAAHALRWAIDEAELRGSVLEAVLVYPYRPQLGEAWAYGLTPQLADAMFDEAREAAEAELNRVLKDVVPDDTRIQVEARVVEGRPAERLIALAAGAEMLVVGSRGLGGFKSLVLGSVSSQCVHHAPCPVVVVPEAELDK